MVIDGLVHRGRGLREPRWGAQVLPEELRLAVNALQAAGPEDPLHHSPGPPPTTRRVTAEPRLLWGHLLNEPHRVLRHQCYKTIF